MKTFKDGQQNINNVYNNIGKIAKEVSAQHTKEIDKIIKLINDDIDNLSDEKLRLYMLKLSCEAYYLGDRQEHSNIKADIAQALNKEAFAKEFLNASGTQQAKNQEAQNNTVTEQTLQVLYKGIYNLMKTKLDETHRMVNTINSILISRSAAAKLAQE